MSTKISQYYQYSQTIDTRSQKNNSTIGIKGERQLDPYQKKGRNKNASYNDQDFKTLDYSLNTVNFNEFRGSDAFEPAEVETKTKSGNYIANTTVKLKLLEPKHVNKAIEKELVEFKKEVEQKFTKSRMNQTYIFPKKSEEAVKSLRSKNPVQEEAEMTPIR